MPFLSPQQQCQSTISSIFLSIDCLWCCTCFCRQCWSREVFSRVVWTLTPKSAESRPTSSTYSLLILVCPSVRPLYFSSLHRWVYSNKLPGYKILFDYFSVRVLEWGALKLYAVCILRRIIFKIDVIYWIVFVGFNKDGTRLMGMSHMSWVNYIYVVKCSHAVSQPEILQGCCDLQLQVL